MKSLFIVCAVAALALAAMVQAIAQETGVALRPGRYSITSTSQSPGQPAGPGTSGEHCISAADMKDPENVFDPAVHATSRKNDTCHVTNFSRNGDVISYDLQCPRAFVHIEATLSGDSFKGSRTVKPRPGAATRVTYNFQGKRVGDCR